MNQEPARRTRGGWEPVGTAAARRQSQQDKPTDRGEVRRQQLTEAARRVFERDGYQSARVADIAREAGVSHGTFYSYYANKQEIFHAVGAEVSKLFLVEARPARASRDMTPQQVIRRSNEGYLRWHKANSRWLAVVEEASGTDEVAHERRLAARRREVARVARSIRRWQAEGQLDPSIAPEPTAGALVSMMVNFAYWLYEGGDKYDEQEAIDTVTTVWLKAIGLSVE